MIQTATNSFYNQEKERESKAQKNGKNEGDKAWSDCGHPPGDYEKLKFQVLKRQFSLVLQLCPTLCNPMDCSMPGFPVHQEFPELAQTHVNRVSGIVQPSPPLLSPSPSASGSFPMSQLITSAVQSIGASASASVLQINIQS